MRHFFKKFCVIFLLCIPFYARAANVQNDVDVSRDDLQRFATALKAIKSYYVEPVSDDKLFANAIRGMLEGLDPHSSYLDAQDMKDLSDTANGEFTGLGMEVVPEDGFIRVVSPIDDTPAQKAGIKPGDLIVKIDGKLIKGMDMRDAINKMRGKPGTSLTLTLYRKETSQLLKVKVIRKIIHVQSVKNRMLTPNYGYIRISVFQMDTPAAFEKALLQLQKQSNYHLRGVVLDLRNNPGGLLDSAVGVANTLLDSEKLPLNHLIVYTEGRLPETRISVRATGTDLLHSIPIVVLVNGNSASGAEVVAGALQDYKRGLIVGTTTFGKGSVQSIFPLDNITGIKLTTARYFTPSGRSIQATGIVPDVVVGYREFAKTTEDDTDDLSIKEADLIGHLANTSDNGVPATPATTINDADDYQLMQALNLLKGLTVYDRN